MISPDSKAPSVGSVLAIHMGDLYVRSSFLDPTNAPTTIEDESESQRFLTPSIATLDGGGGLLGYPALLASANVRAGTTRWRYRRSGLTNHSAALSDSKGRGLTSGAFAALVTRRLCTDAVGWTASQPEPVLIVPSEMSGYERLALATLASESAERPVGTLDEDQSLMFGLGIAPSEAPVLVISVDDDSARLRLLKRVDGEMRAMFVQVLPAQGLLALRQAWLDRWNREVNQLIPGSEAFGDGESFEFEMVWQDIWQCLEIDPRLKPRMPTWSAVRNSTLVPLTISRQSLQADLDTFWLSIGQAAVGLLTQATCAPSKLSSLVVVAPTAIGRVLCPVIAENLGFPQSLCRTVTANIYAQGGARLFAAAKEKAFNQITKAPHRLGAFGMAKDEAGLTLKPLIEAGAPLPASANFSIMANRDVQKRLSIRLAREVAGGPPEVCQQTEFGPLHGQGMQKIKINVAWTQDGRVAMTALDAESGDPLPVLDSHEMAASGPKLSGLHIRQLD